MTTVRDSILGDLSYAPKDHYWCLSVGWQLGRLEFLWRNESFDEQMNELVAKEAAQTIEAIKRTLVPGRVTTR